MARRLLLLGGAGRGHASGASAGTAAAAFILCAFAVMACSRRGRWRRLLPARRRGGGGDPVISIHRVQPGTEGDACLWQRSILMGEKCQLPDFSGVINYDAAGNPVKKPAGAFDEIRALQ